MLHSCFDADSGLSTANYGGCQAIYAHVSGLNCFREGCIQLFEALFFASKFPPDVNAANAVEELSSVDLTLTNIREGNCLHEDLVSNDE